MGTGTEIAEWMRILVLDMKNHVTEDIKPHLGTVNSSVLRTSEAYRPAVSSDSPDILNLPQPFNGDPTPLPEDRPQVTRYFIGISPEKGFFINPALLAANAPDTAA